MCILSQLEIIQKIIRRLINDHPPPKIKKKAIWENRRVNILGKCNIRGAVLEPYWRFVDINLKQNQ